MKKYRGCEKDNWRVNTFSGDGNAHRARLFIASSLHQVWGFLYDNVGDFNKSNSEFFIAIKIAEEADNKEELSLDYMSLGGS